MLPRRADSHIDSLFRQQFLHPLGPFDHDDSTLLEQFSKSNRVEIIRAAEAVRIKMKHLQPDAVVDVEQYKCRAADGVCVAIQPLHNPANKLRLPRAQVAIQRPTLPAAKRAGQLRAERFGFVNAVGDARGQKVCSQPLGSSGVRLPFCSRNSPFSSVMTPTGKTLTGVERAADAVN